MLKGVSFKVLLRGNGFATATVPYPDADGDNGGHRLGLRRGPNSVAHLACAPLAFVGRGKGGDAALNRRAGRRHRATNRRGRDSDKAPATPRPSPRPITGGGHDRSRRRGPSYRYSQGLGYKVDRELGRVSTGRALEDGKGVYVRCVHPGRGTGLRPGPVVTCQEPGPVTSHHPPSAIDVDRRESATLVFPAISNARKSGPLLC